MSTLEISLIIAFAAQVPLLALAFLVEFSQRKKQPSRPLAAPSVRPQSERPVAEPAPQEPPSPALFGPTPEPSHEASVAAETPAPPELPKLEPELPTSELPAVEPAPIPPAAVSEPASIPGPVEEPQKILATPPPEVGESLITPPTEAQAQPSAPEPIPPAATEPLVEEPAREPVRIGLGLRKTRENFIARIRAAITGSGKADEIYEGLEEALLGAATGVETSLKIVEAVRGRLKNDARPEVIRNALKEEIESILISAERPFADSGDAPLVIMMAGVNGAGKTTTVAKLAALFKRERGLVVVAASDTFRAAAIEQLRYGAIASASI